MTTSATFKVIKMKSGTDSTVYDCSLLTLPKFEVERGAITSVNNKSEIPFAIKRVYYLYDVPSGSDRGAHAHKELQQLIVAASGSFTVAVDDGKLKRSFILSQPNVGLYLPPGLWRELTDFSGGSICLVLANHEYKENDYIRDYHDFKKFKQSI